MYILPIRYYLFGLLSFAAGSQTVHLILKPMKDLEDLYDLKKQLYLANIEKLNELENQRKLS